MLDRVIHESARRDSCDDFLNRVTITVRIEPLQRRKVCFPFRDLESLVGYSRRGGRRSFVFSPATHISNKRYDCKSEPCLGKGEGDGISYVC